MHFLEIKTMHYYGAKSAKKFDCQQFFYIAGTVCTAFVRH